VYFFLTLNSIVIDRGVIDDPGPCSYCTKTKKTCTFEWLRSQEPTSKAHKNGTEGSSARNGSKKLKSEPSPRAPSSSTPSTSPGQASPLSGSSNGTAGSTTQTEQVFEIPEDSSLDYLNQGAELQFCPSYTSEELDWCQSAGSHSMAQLFPTHSTALPSVLGAGIDWDDSGSSPTDISFLLPRQKRALLGGYAGSQSDDPETEDESLHFSRVEFAFDPSFATTADYLSRSANHTLWSESLMKIYHDSMENALSCWLNERTCPYRYKPTPKAITNGDSSQGEDVKQAWAEDWPNRIFRRVFNLDRVAGKIRAKPLSHSEDSAASKALYLVIMAFATQWAQSSKRSKEEHPAGGKDFPNSMGPPDVNDHEFDRVMQQSYWAAARKALLECADIESFKVAFANIIFSLTQKPMSQETQAEIRRDSTASSQIGSSMTFEELQEKVDKVIDEDGPPIYLEQGVRHLHSLRHKLQRRERELAKSNPGSDPKQTILKEEDRTTVELLAWLGYMLESLTSAMHQRPLVVSDEDCDVLPEAIEALNLKDDEIPAAKAHSSRLWDDFFFLQDQSNRRGELLRYPCSYKAAAAGLTDAAPIKVLLYRKVTLLQNLFNRGASASKIENTIKDSMKVYEYWQRGYEPFFKDCIRHHDQLHQRIQSWYICLCGHWHLATLLLADVIESIDEAQLSSESDRRMRRIGNLVGQLRRHNSHLVSDLARCATPRADASFPNSKAFHFALNAGALLTEPWTAILIRVFSKAAVQLMCEAWMVGQEETHDMLRSQQLTKRCEDCIRALKYLGRKSDTARLAGDTLAEALHQKQREQYATAAAVSAVAASWGESELGIAATGRAGWLAQGDESLGDVSLFGTDINGDPGFGFEAWH
jgi:hypothetical protein